MKTNSIRKMLMTGLCLIIAGSLFAADPLILFDGITHEGAEVYKLYGDTGSDYAINGYLVIPRSVSLNHMNVHPWKRGWTEPEIVYKENDVRHVIYDGDWHSTIDRELGAIALYPVIPELRNDFRHLELDPETLTSNDDYKWMDRQVLAMIGDALDFIQDCYIADISDRVNLIGYSGEGNFSVRFALLHPEAVHAVCAGGVSWAVPLPLTNFGGKRLNYPMGIADIGKYNGRVPFDTEAWKDIKFFVDMGALDDRGSYMHGIFDSLNWPWGRDWMGIWEAFTDRFVELTSNGEAVTYHSLGHETDGKDYIRFLRENDTDGKPLVFIEPLRSSTVKIQGRTWEPEVDEWYEYRPSWNECSCGSKEFSWDFGRHNYVCDKCGRGYSAHDLQSPTAGVYRSVKPVGGYGKIELRQPDDHYNRQARRLILGDGRSFGVEGNWGLYEDGRQFWTGRGVEVIIGDVGGDWLDVDLTIDGVRYENVRFRSIID